ncbi:MarR family transcriptional regulator [Glaesserella parasuis]|uniref:MarR family transcriptional regulator n=1 Tax=Glaesserella parasuis TaxID=738 RepID=UPI000992F150|nr:MarR family transcriptional regulator [Glaesserella parasuis]MDE3996184.1 MarR family transcriptional regulator [Glaesserella parasuis]MDE4014073.1 MarR family transcriptional regulator [Glaesserella parasuis]MDG4922900.1 MarR family transcriptional regulator [Glaesserella parasuis]MDG6226983.1 MarR family transcriptional regulator [Glaesserella parasuis]MDG6232880.1 MarR family transcriptional regulator [Glaesserella parasuis]
MPPFDKLVELAAQLSSIYASVAKQHQLTLNELHFLYSIGRYGATSPTAIGDKWSLPKQTVTSVCKQLDQKGFLAFLPDENDKRSKLIALSASGKIFIDPIIARLTEAELQVTLKLALIFSKRVSANTAMKKF